MPTRLNPFSDETSVFSQKMHCVFNREDIFFFTLSEIRLSVMSVFIGSPSETTQHESSFLFLHGNTLNI